MPGGPASNLPAAPKRSGELICHALVEEEWSVGKAVVVGAVTLIYDPGHDVLSHTLTRTQHENHDAIVSSQHIHLDEDNRLEVIMLRGIAADVHQLADHLRNLEGMKCGQFLMTTTGKGLG